MQNTSSLPDLPALKTVHVVGPKPHVSRALFKHATTLVLGVALGFPLAYAKHYIKTTFFDDPTPSLAAPRSMQPSLVLPTDNTWLQAMAGRSNQELGFDVGGQRHVVNTVSYEDAAVLFDEMKLNADQRLDVFLHMKAAYSALVFGADQPELKKQFTQLQASSQRWLDSAWEIDPAQWDQQLGTTQERRQSVLLLAPSKVRDGSWETLSENEKLADVKEFWTALSFSFLRNPDSGLPIAGTGDLDQSYQHLQQAVSQAGLAALIVPFAYKEDPYLIEALAQEVNEVSDELSHQVGWSNKAMGLNYRMVLDHSALDRSAFAQQNQSLGWIMVQSHWDTFSHEWFHALQKSLASDEVNQQEKHMEDVLSHIKDPALTEKQRLQIQEYASHVMKVRSDETSPMFQALQNVDLAVSKSGVAPQSSWVVWRQQAANQLEKTNPSASVYLMSEHEILATSFASFVALDSFQSSQPSLLRDRKLWAGSSISYNPTYPETQSITPSWKMFFDQLDPWWVHDSNKRLPPSLKDKAVARRASSEHQANASPSL